MASFDTAPGTPRMPAASDMPNASGASTAPRTPGTLSASAQVRQGDVLLVPIDEIPDAARPLARTRGRVVLAEGEVTGHAHAIRSAAATLHAAGEERYLRVAAPVVLGHEEHAPIGVAPGTYRVVIQREYVPPEISPVAFRRVVD